jgi:hypothetical protein
LSTEFAPILPMLPPLVMQFPAVPAKLPAILPEIAPIAAQLAGPAGRIVEIAPEFATIAAEIPAIVAEIPPVATELASLRSRRPVLAAEARMKGVLRACGGRRKGRGSEQEGSKQNATHGNDPLKETPWRRRAPDRVKRSGAPER